MPLESTGQGVSVLARRTLRVLGVVVVVYAVAIATHGGEFWPFSSYSMFARAGRPWQRALVRVLDEATADGALADSYAPDALPGSPLALAPLGIPQNDLSSLLQRAEVWGDTERKALARLFGTAPCRAPLLVLRASGAIEAEGVRQRAVPVAVLSCEGGRAQVHPQRLAGVEAS